MEAFPNKYSPLQKTQWTRQLQETRSSEFVKLCRCSHVKAFICVSTPFWSNMFPETGLPEQNICYFFQYRKLEYIRI